MRGILPPSPETFAADRTAREVVALNLMVAIQACVGMASHWLADAGWPVPSTYAQTFLSLAEHGVIERSLAERLAAAAGLRNLLVHQYGTVDWRRLHGLASSGLGDLEAFCAVLAVAAG